MNWLYDLVTNPFLITSLSAWAVAQVLKTVLYAIINKKLDMSRLFGDGGMPSGHSATVSSLALISALTYGVGSFQFAVSAILAIVICHDAMGVRLETGKQSVVINQMLKSFEELFQKRPAEITLKEFVGHTPLQVLAGVVIGLLDAVVVYQLLG